MNPTKTFLSFFWLLHLTWANAQMDTSVSMKNATIEVKVKSSLKPKVCIGYLDSGVVRLSELLKQKKVIVKFCNDTTCKDFKYKVTKYRMVIGSSLTYFFNGIEGEGLTPEIISAFSILKTGDMISVYDVEAEGKDKTKLEKLHSGTFRVVK